MTNAEQIEGAYSEAETVARAETALKPMPATPLRPHKSLTQTRVEKPE